MQVIFHELWTMPNAVSISIAVVLVAGLLVIVFIMGIQPKRNAIFEFSIPKNPLIAAIVLFGCIFLFASFSVWAWCRIGAWTFIGNLIFSLCKYFGIMINVFSPFQIKRYLLVFGAQEIQKHKTPHGHTIR